MPGFFYALLLGWGDERLIDFLIALRLEIAENQSTIH